MINYISKFFTTNNSEKLQITNNSIIFEIDQNQKTNVWMELKDTSPEAASNFGFFLFLLNEGYYVQTIIDILSKTLKEDDEEKSIFVQKIISTWSQKITENSKYDSDINNDPIIKPTEFNTSINKN
jgi:hypothetical protein